MDFSLDINQAIVWTARLAALCIVIDSFEKFWNIREFFGDGIFSWQKVREFYGIRQRRALIRRLADAVFNTPTWIGLLFLRGGAAVYLLIFAGQYFFYPLALLILFTVGSLANFRRMPVFPETPNRFTLLVFGALFLQSLVPTANVSLACLWFIALQSALSYMTAGILKLSNPDWRRGRGVLNSTASPYYFTSAGPAEFLDRFPYLARGLNYLTIVIESLFPLVLVIGAPYYLIFLIWGVAFHLMNAYFLRLNNYIWPWIATYPAIIYIAQS